MKQKPKLIRRAAVFSSLVVVTAVALAQAAIPSKLSGRWSTPDGASSQSISVVIDAATSKGTLTVWSNIPDCNIREAPIAVTAAGDKLTFKVDSSWSNSCRADVSVEISKKPGSDEYEGELRQGGPAGARFPVLRVKMSP